MLSLTCRVDIPADFAQEAQLASSAEVVLKTYSVSIRDSVAFPFERSEASPHT
jgi:hypothetical protein